ncbi:MAG TPA: asparaginase [Egibacteraceae bacterium]
MSRPGGELEAAPVVVHVIRDGVVESAHRGHAAVVDSDGGQLAGLGAPDAAVYVRSAAKPFQAAASVELCDDAGVALDADAVAIASASHSGSDTHQIEAARILALADLDETALRCPAALPSHVPTLLDQRVPTPLAHNCSGKHAAFLLAQTLRGDDPARYLDPSSALQRLVAERLADHSHAAPAGPGVDGCGAPAWRLPLTALARAFAALAAPAAGSPLARVRDAMTARPDLVGGSGCPDTELMLADARVVAKRGAEAVLAAGLRADGGRGVGVAVKIVDGNARGAVPVAAALLEGLGAGVPAALLSPPVLGAGRAVGHLTLAAGVRDAVAKLEVT